MIRDIRQQRILHVDLTHGNTWTEAVSQSDLLKYLGGRGIAAKLLYECLEKGADPLGPDNPLIFSAGSLSGTSAPSTGASVSPSTTRPSRTPPGSRRTARSAVSRSMPP